jgi:hypothetical protein
LGDRILWTSARDFAVGFTRFWESFMATTLIALALLAALALAPRPVPARIARRR